MKAIAINASPRRGRNTEQLLQSALKGAESVGVETKLVQLYDLRYSGCRSCFACKRVGAEPCRCALNDGLTPVLDEIFGADAVFLGSPIYFWDVTGQMMCFLERLSFPLLSYDDHQKRLFDGHINAAFFFTMNVTLPVYEKHLANVLQDKVGMLNRLGGKVEVYASCDTLQFDDYTKYHAAMFDEAHKRQVHAEQFPKDLAAAYDIGRRLTTPNA